MQNSRNNINDTDNTRNLSCALSFIIYHLSFINCFTVADVRGLLLRGRRGREGGREGRKGHKGRGRKGVRKGVRGGEVEGST